MTERLTPKIHFEGDTKPKTSTKPTSERAVDKESFREFKRELQTEYGEEFIFSVIGFSTEKYQETTPFGVNYEKNIRDFARKFPSFSKKLKDDYERAKGKPHRIIEKALAQNEYLEKTYKDTKKKSTDLTIPIERRVYYDPDGYPNLQIDPSFYQFVVEKQTAGVSSKQEILSLFAKEFPEKASGYKVALPNSEKWELKGSGSERLAEIITEQGIEAFSKTIDCNGAKLETIIFPTEPSKEKTVRIYRGVVTADQTILRQLPYAARGRIEFTEQNETNRQTYASKIQEVPGISDLVSEIAKNPSMESIGEYAQKMRQYFLEKNMSAELRHLDETLNKFALGILKGYSLENMLAIEQRSGGMYTAQYLLAPFVSATPNFEEAWNYGRGGVIVYDIPETELTGISSNSECMMNGVIDEKYIRMLVHHSSDVSIVTVKDVEAQIQKNIAGEIYQKNELDEVGRRNAERRELREKENSPQNKKIAMEILLRTHAGKYPYAELNPDEFLSLLDQIDFNNPSVSIKEFNQIKAKVNEKYIAYMLQVSPIFEISTDVIKRELDREEADQDQIIKRFFERFDSKQNSMEERLSEHLPDLQIDFNSVVEEAIKYKSSINTEIYRRIKAHCDQKGINIPEYLKSYYQ